MNQRERSRIQEDLVSLYLRLNGFFVTQGFIVHSSDHGRNLTELDVLALRLPFNSEPEREISHDPLLQLADNNTELFLCEVKSRQKKLRFNQPLVEHPRAMSTIIRWSGLLPEREVDDAACGLIEAIRHGDSAVSPARTVRIRAMLFSPERRARRHNQPFFVTGPELLKYVWKCMCPKEPRADCATSYDLQLWGRNEAIVRYIKSHATSPPDDIRELYAYISQN